jgi:hypothetical protein
MAIFNSYVKLPEGISWDLMGIRWVFLIYLYLFDVGNHGTSMESHYHPIVYNLLFVPLTIGWGLKISGMIVGLVGI